MVINERVLKRALVLATLASLSAPLAGGFEVRAQAQPPNQDKKTNQQNYLKLRKKKW